MTKEQGFGATCYDLPSLSPPILLTDTLIGSTLYSSLIVIHIS